MHADAQNDETARNSILADFDTTFLVEAAAGTGKTTAMVGRMVGLLREGRALSSNIAAITFSRKSAGELRRRFQDELEHAASAEAGELPRNRLREAIDSFDDITIRTIHAFCAELLRAHPVEGCVAPGFRLLDDDEAFALRRASFRNFVDALPLTHPEALDTMAELDLDFDALLAGYDLLCEQADVEFAAGDSAPPDVSSAISQIEGFVNVLLPMIAVTESECDPLQQAVLRAERLFKDDRSMLRDATIISLFIPKGVGDVVLKKWSDRDEAKVLKQELFPGLKRGVIVPAYRDIQAWRYARLMPLLADAREFFSEKKSAAGVLDNNDVLLRARDMLRDHPLLRATLAARFTHVLVDEFQDTDPVQAELLLYLCGDGTAGAAWRELRLRPGALFVVGDPKQSIYRFRRADISVYNDVRHIILESGGAVLELSRNFRSTAAVCETINDMFSSIFPEAPDPRQAVNVPLRPVRGNGGSLCGVVELPIRYSSTNRDDCATEAAEAVAGWIARVIADGATMSDQVDGGVVERPILASDVMILTRYNADIPRLAAALDDAGVRFALDGGLPVGDTDELRLLQILLRVLADPEDEAAMVAWLRSAWCGVDDAALLRWRTDGGSFKLTTRFKPGMDERIERGLLFIKNSMRLVRSAPPGAVVSAMMADYGTIPALSLNKRGAMRAGIFSSLLAMIRKHSTAGIPLIDIAAILEEQSGSLRAAATLNPNEAGVRISTLHKAKGREAPVVIVFTPSPFANDSLPSSVVDRSGDGSQGWMQIARGGNRNDPLGIIAVPRGWEARQQSERLYVAAEEDRLRYVAATRARNCLVLMPSKNGDGLFSAATLRAHGIAAAPDVPPTIPAAQEASDSIPDPAHIETELATKRATMAQPTFARYNAGAMGKTAEHPHAIHGRGPEFGALFHQLLRFAIDAPAEDLRNFAVTLLRATPVQGATVEELLALLDTVISHELWKRILAADKRMTEVPFAFHYCPEGGLPGVLRGDIDLAFHDGAGWTIVDYKTDIVGDAIDEYVSFYAPQIHQYCAAWRQLTGEAARGILWFVTSQIAVSIDETEG